MGVGTGPQPQPCPTLRSSRSRVRDTSASYVDVKLYNGNEVLFDLSVQVQFCDEALIRDARVGAFRPSVVISVFTGWKVSVFSFEVVRRSYSVGPHGTVYAGDRCRSRFELRVVDRGSDDAIDNGVWKASLKDVEEGSALGPFFASEEVDRVVSCRDWIPTQRFEVIQKNKVRGCDLATNLATEITEKLQLPSTDSNVSVIRVLRQKVWAARRWVLDERRAYRQIPIRPEHRKFSVIVLKDPASVRIGFFVMIGIGDHCWIVFPVPGLMSNRCTVAFQC